MDTLRQDLVYAFRVLVKRPGFTVIAALTLAIGIAANTTIFSLVNAVVLRPLPFPHAERLISLWTSYPASQGQPDIFSPPNYLDVASRAQTMQAVGSFDEASFTLASDGEPASIAGALMSASMTSVLGVTPQLGRWFTVAEDTAAEPVVLLGDSLWRNRFGADRGIVGKSLVLNGKAYRVLGVLPPRVAFPTVLTQLYAPISFSADDRAARGSVFLNVAARLRPGMSHSTAVAELGTIAASLAAAYPRDNEGIRMGAVPLQQNMVGDAGRILLVLWAAVAFMLAVGCANVANLLLAHAAGRQREFALRRSLGATGGRVVRLLLTESIVLAGAGGAIGLVMAIWAVPAVIRLLPPGFPRLGEVGLDGTVLWFTFGVSLLTGVLFGLAPAVGSARRNLSQALREGDRGGRSAGQRRLGRALVVAELATVLVLMAGAGLVLRSLWKLSGVDPGFRARGVIAWQLFLPPARYPNAAAQRALLQNVVEQVRALPGVESAGLVSPLPFGPIDLVNDGDFTIAGQPDPSPEQHPQALFARADPGYFAAMGIPVKRGRVFDARDSETAPPVAVVSETLARRYFGTRDPLGQRILLGSRNLPTEIVGVVGDVKHINLKSTTRPEIYLPLARFTPRQAGLVVRTRGDAAALLPALERRVWSVDNAMAGNLAAPVERLLYASMAPARVATVLLGSFAAVTLLLGLAGVYGVLSYSVRQRTREIGIRLALGASQGEVSGLVMREALALSGAGVLLGLAVALALSRYMASLLFGVDPHDPATFAVVSIAAPGAALLAAYVPARRAMRVDPAVSLRSE